MTQLYLPDGRTAIDMDRLGAAFSINRHDLESRIGLGTITYWFEQGGSDLDRPRMVFHASESGTRVTLDAVGNIVPSSEGADGMPPMPRRTTGPRSSDALLDEALKGTFPASDPIAIDFGSNPHRG